MTLDHTEILTQVQRCFGTACQLESVVQFKGGARKQVYFLALNHPQTSCVMYIWHNVDNYFAERVDGGFEETQSDAQAPALFLAHTRYLLDLGVNVPQVLHAGILASGHHFALVERVGGYEVARAFAGHAEPDVTSHYAKASIEEVAAAVAHINGEPHPLAVNQDVPTYFDRVQ